MSDAAPLHPRPQLTRPEWTDLCGTWDFGYDDADLGLDQRWYAAGTASDPVARTDDPFDRTIVVPFPPESPASGIGDRGYHPVVWYRRTVAVPAPTTADRRLLLHLGAVDYRASVWVDGRLVVEHEGGHTPFLADITAAVGDRGSAVLTVRAEDRPTDPTQPRGKQDWLERPHTIFYERTTGIWQPVWLEQVPATHIAAVRWTPDLARAELAARVVVAGPIRPGLRLRLRLSLRGTPLADETYAISQRVTRRTVPLDQVSITQHYRDYLWAPEHPNLLDATLTLIEDDHDADRPGDEVQSYAGLRSVGCTGGRFVLNSRPYVLRLVLAQNYWPESHLAAPSPDALRAEVEWVKRLGFNGVRIHQKVEDPRFLSWCDRLGVLVWDELPSALEFDTTTIARLTREWLEVLERDAGAPSVVAWVPFNESWGVPALTDDPAQRDAVRALYYLTRAIDPTRPVIGNDGWEHLVSDIFGVHDYSASGAVLRERYGSDDALARTLSKVQPHYRTLVLPDRVQQQAPLVVTEFGGITYDAAPQTFWNGYGAVQSADELRERYQELVTALLDSPVVAGFCYTQLTDTAQERNGLLDEHRVPKVDPAVLAAVTCGPSASVPADAIAEIQIVHAAQTWTDGPAG